MQKHFLVPTSQMLEFSAFPFNYFNLVFIMLRFGLLVGHNKHCEAVTLDSG